MSVDHEAAIVLSQGAGEGAGSPFNSSAMKESVKQRIHVVRDKRVMLDQDIAGFFGVETGAMNRAMKRNASRFPESFCFQITREEYREILRCQTGILELEQGRYSKYLPYAYTEQGVSMLTSVLHSERAISASIQIIEAFVEMAHVLYVGGERDFASELYYLLKRQDMAEADILKIKGVMLTRADLPMFMRLFDQGTQREEVLILDGEPLKADVAYQEIYSKAKSSIVVVDDYIGVKTLQHLEHAPMGVVVTIVSDNRASPPLTAAEFRDFEAECPGHALVVVPSRGRCHDRYIALDLGTPGVQIYHCGASSKDAGGRITTISRLQDTEAHERMISGLLAAQSVSPECRA